jgi:hypothetical protein
MLRRIGGRLSALGFSLLSSNFELLVSGKYFLEKRTQTLPVIIDDREKTNPKRTQIKPKRTQIYPKKSQIVPCLPPEPKL